MCDPVSLTIMTVGSAAMGAMSAFQQAAAQRANLQAQANQAQYQAQIARNNQIIAERNAARFEEIGERQAKQVEEQGQLEANRYRRRIKEHQADQMVRFAGQGVDVTQGSSIDLLADTAELGELDARTIESNTRQAASDARYGSAMDAYSARVSGSNQAASANLYQNSSRNFNQQAGSVNPLMSGVSSLLQGAGTVASKWNFSSGGSAGGSQSFVSQANKLNLAF